MVHSKYPGIQQRTSVKFTTRKAEMKAEKLWSLLLHTIVIIGTVIVLGPFVWMVSTSFKPPGQVISFPPTLIPRPPSLQHYKRIFTEMNFGLFFFNSIYISIVTTVSSVLTSAFVGYVFAKFKFWGRNVLFLAILATLMIPFPLLMIPLFFMMTILHLNDTHLAIILPYIYRTFGIFLVRQYAHTIPNEIIDSARVDGASEFRIFTSIILPLFRPILSALTIFLFMMNWENFVWPLIIIQDGSKYTLPLGLAMFSLQWFTQYGPIMAGAVITIIPILIIFLFMQKHFVKGVVLSGLKV